LTVVRISSEWVANPEENISIGRTSKFSFWIGVFGHGITSITDETVIPL
jgi:hypothetical protein